MTSSGEILDVQWRSGNRTVCFVAVQYERYWQAYVTASLPVMIQGGLTIGVMESSERTISQCVNYGARLSWREAQAFFPDFDITKYKTFSNE